MTSTLEDKRIQNVYETIRNQYAFLHWNLYGIASTKDLKIEGPVNDAYIEKMYPLHPRSIEKGTFILEDQYGKYTIDANIAAWAANEEIKAGGRLQILGETAIICSFAIIVSKYKELLDVKNNGSVKFHSFVENKLRKTNNNFEDFFGIITLFRNVFSHSIDYNYKLVKSDFEGPKGWKQHWIGKGKKYLKIDLQIDHPDKHKLKIIIKIADIKEGVTIQEFINTYQMFVLIEFCITSLHKYLNP